MLTSRNSILRRAEIFFSFWARDIIANIVRMDECLQVAFCSSDCYQVIYLSFFLLWNFIWYCFLYIARFNFCAINIILILFNTWFNLFVGNIYFDAIFFLYNFIIICNLKLDRSYIVDSTNEHRVNYNNKKYPLQTVSPQCLSLWRNLQLSELINTTAHDKCSNSLVIYYAK